MNGRPEGWALITNRGVRFHYFRNGQSLCGRYKQNIALRTENPQKEFCCRECYKLRMREP